MQSNLIDFPIPVISIKHYEILAGKDKKRVENGIYYHLQERFASAGQPIFDHNDFTTLSFLHKNPEPEYKKAVRERA